MKKMKTGIGVMLALLCCILMCTGFVYATGDDTDGTELQVAQVYLSSRPVLNCKIQNF